MTDFEPAELPSKLVILAQMPVRIHVATAVAEADGVVDAVFASVVQQQLAIHAATTPVVAVDAAVEQ